MSTKVARDINGHPIQAVRPGTVQNVTMGTASAATSNAVGAVSVVRVYSPDDIYLSFGATPTASTASTVMAAGAEYFRVEPSVDKIAVLQKGTSGGDVNITEMT